MHLQGVSENQKTFETNRLYLYSGVSRCWSRMKNGYDSRLYIETDVEVAKR